MKKLLSMFTLVLLCGTLASVASAYHLTDIPDGVDPAPTDYDPRVECDVQVRYDDGSDDAPSSGPTLGHYAPGQWQYCGVVFTPPAGANLVQSASWYSDFWVFPGMVDVTAIDASNPANTTTASINVTGGGTWEVDFATPICIPDGGDYHIMICPQPGTFGVVGDDYASPDNRSYFTPSPGGCELGSLWSGVDFMIWSCVTPCGPVPVENSTWGRIKSMYQ